MASSTERVAKYRERRARQRHKQIAIYLPTKLLASIDKDAKRRQLSRSDVIRERLEASTKAGVTSNVARSATTRKKAAKRSQPREHSAAFDLQAFAQAVLASASAPAVERFGENKAFISSIWQRMRRKATCKGMTMNAFKQRLVEANSKGLLRLSRADLVSAMDPELVAESETRYLNAMFHFVRLD